MKQTLMALALVAGTLGSAGGAQAASGLYPFIVGPPSETKEQFLERLQGKEFFPKRTAFVTLFDHVVGESFTTFGEVVDFIKSPDVTLGQCNWDPTDPRFIVYGVELDKVTFDSLHRGCYRDGKEKVLIYHEKAFISLDCGNLLGDNRAPKEKKAEVVPTPLPTPEKKAEVVPTPEKEASTLYLDGVLMEPICLVCYWSSRPIPNNVVDP